MRRRYVILCIFLWPLMALSQQSPPNPNAENDGSSASGGPTTIVGCVISVNGSFTLGTRSGDRYRLKGDHDTLFSYNGKEVRITGTVTSSKGGPRTLKVSGIKKLYDTCQYD